MGINQRLLRPLLPFPGSHPAPITHPQHLGNRDGQSLGQRVGCVSLSLSLSLWTVQVEVQVIKCGVGGMGRRHHPERMTAVLKRFTHV